MALLRATPFPARPPDSSWKRCACWTKISATPRRKTPKRPAADMSLRVAILTVSDSVSSGKYEDRSGPAVLQRCMQLGWETVSCSVLADDRPAIEAFLKKTSDSGAVDLILTTGGTGLGPRDLTPEATMAVCDRLIPGFPEQMRLAGAKKTSRAIRSTPWLTCCRTQLPCCTARVTIEASVSHGLRSFSAERSRQCHPANGHRFRIAVHAGGPGGARGRHRLLSGSVAAHQAAAADRAGNSGRRGGCVRRGENRRRAGQ